MISTKQDATYFIFYTLRRIEVDVAQKELKVIRRECNPDFDILLSYNYNTEILNEIVPAPIFNSRTVDLAVPLKFSNLKERYWRQNSRNSRLN